MSQTWPSAAQLDPVSRLRILSESISSVLYAEKHIPVPYYQLWSVASDLEQQMPRLITGLSSFRLAEATASRIEARAAGVMGTSARFDVVLRDGWCLMQSRFVVGGMAARPEGDGTRFAVLGGLRWRHARYALLPLRPIGRVRGRLMISKVERQLGVS
jgi:hypothetical protein